MPSNSAARVNLPVSADANKYRNASKSIVLCGFNLTTSSVLSAALQSPLSCDHENTMQSRYGLRLNKILKQGNLGQLNQINSSEYIGHRIVRLLNGFR